ncbi:MAG TPA: ABC transporter permease, partial [Chitinophagaceae bacterium]|nr:ABC transporter permease [Chitinophagaceae bacterium]
MFKNFFKIAWRNLVRKKVFSAINIIGLALGLAIFTLISLYVLDELSYDRYNELADRIYRVNTHIKVNGTGFNSNYTPAPMADALVTNYPRIEQTVRISGGNDMLVKKDDETLIEKNAFFADTNLFKVFTLDLLKGNPETALSNPNSMIISASMAKKYFNSLDVIGKTLKVDNTDLYNITGVIKDMPSQSHLHFNFIKSMASLESSASNFWLSNSFMTYVLVRKGTTQAELDNYLEQTAKKYAEPQLMNMVHSSFSDLEKNGGHFEYASIPLTKIHLYSQLSSEVESSGNIEYVYISAIIGLLILLIACINFMNLSTAQSAGRAKEVGVRKVIGSGRANLVKQFLTESLLTAMAAFIFSVILIILLIPLLNQLSGKEINLASGLYTWLFPALLCVALICGLLAGIYPAFILSAFDPIKILKGKFILNVRGYKLRNALVIFQFTTAIILITGTLVIYQQLNYIRNKNLGYDRDHVLVLNNAYALGEHTQTFKKEILQLSGVVAGALTQDLPTTTANNWNRNAYSKDATMNASQTQTLVDWAVDAGYIPTLKMEMVKGRNFSPDMPTDSSAIIINETAVSSLGFKDPLNAKLYDFNSRTNQTQEFHVIGVVKDFNAGSLRYTTEPLVMRYSKYGGQFIFRIKSANIPQLLSQIESRYHSFDQMSSQPFIYSFMDEDFNNLYKGEQR